MPDRPPSRSSTSTPTPGSSRDPRQRSKSTGGSVVAQPSSRRPSTANAAGGAGTNKDTNRRSTIATTSKDSGATSTAAVTPRPRQPSTSTTSTIRPSSEYRYSIGPAPVRFPTTSKSRDELADSATASSSKLLPPLSSSPPPRPPHTRRPSSKVLTTFPFPHPTTPKGGAEEGGAEGGKRLGFGWVTGLFTGRGSSEDLDGRRGTEDVERQTRAPLLRSTQHRDYGTRSHSRSRSPSPSHGHHHQRHSQNNTSIDSYPDPSDPYGYRRLAGPSLLPDYHTQHVIPRRRKRSGVTFAQSSWITRQKRLTALFTLLCLVALLASALGWWFAKGEDLRGRLPSGRP